MSNTSPRDQRGLFADAKAKAAREAAAGELLFQFLRGHDRIRCELRDHGRWGVEAQFLKNEEFLFSHRLDSRALAIAWAEIEGQRLRRED